MSVCLLKRKEKRERKKKLSSASIFTLFFPPKKECRVSRTKLSYVVLTVTKVQRIKLRSTWRFPLFLGRRCRSGGWSCVLGPLVHSVPRLVSVSQSPVIRLPLFVEFKPRKRSRPSYLFVCLPLSLVTNQPTHFLLSLSLSLFLLTLCSWELPDPNKFWLNFLFLSLCSSARKSRKNVWAKERETEWERRRIRRRNDEVALGRFQPYYCAL